MTKVIQKHDNVLKNIALILLLAVNCMPAGARSVKLTINDAIKMASDSSLTAFRVRNLFEASRWEYISYRASRLPSLNLNLTPAEYSRSITTRYDYENNIDVYRSQQMYSATGGLNITQNFDLLGGTFFIQSELNYMRNMGDATYHQFSSTPIRIGYNQQLIGFNQFKWDRKIEPLKYERAKKEFITNMENVSLQTSDYFFELALAQTELKLAQLSLASADTLCVIGERRFKIAAISQADLFTLQLDRTNARNSCRNAEIRVRSANAALASYLGLPRETHIELVLPSLPVDMQVPVDEAMMYARENSPVLVSKKQNILEAERELNKRRIERMFSASLNASVGYNQVGSKFNAAYRHLLRQDLVSVTLSIPLIDWGVRKGRYHMALSNLDVTKTESREEESNLMEEVARTVEDFNVQVELIRSAKEAMDLSERAFQQVQKRFIIGQADLSALTLASNRRQESTRNYVTSLRNYWASYFKLRKMTLYDFEMKIPLARKFDLDNKVSTRLR